MSRVPPLWAARHAAALVPARPAMVPVVSCGLLRALGHFGDARPDTPVAAKLQSWVDECRCCGATIGWDKSYQLSCGDVVHEHCREEFEEAENERRYERSMEDAWGGDQPWTAQERYQADAAEKRAMG